MNEELLHFLWKRMLFSQPLTDCVTGAKIEVLNPGQHNHDQGPDFFDARIKIGDVTWAGNVEMHVKASDWQKHHHQTDSRYDSIVLHVVWQNDQPVCRASGELIPTVELSCSDDMRQRYQYLMQTRDWLPCESFVAKINSFVMAQWRQRLAIERIEDKTKVVAELFAATNNNWEETFYQLLARTYGLKVNAEPFVLMAQSLPLNVVARHKHNRLQVEALVFGQAGLLPDNPTEEYTQLLVREHTFLRHKYNLTPIDANVWKFARMHLSNTPPVRLAQFAALIYESSSLMSKIVECEHIAEIKKYFDADISDYWHTHYNFGKESKRAIKGIGNFTFNILVINAIVPFMFYYAKSLAKPHLIDRALSWLEQILPEDNNIIRSWTNVGVECENASDSQALIQLTNCYCKQRRCLHCAIGNQVMVHRFT